jgi:hypothetical protein
MKKISIFLAVLLFSGSSCKPSYVNNEVSILLDEFCLTDKSKFENPVKREDLINVEGIVFEHKGLGESKFYIKAKNSLYFSCKLSNDFKKNGLTIIFTGTSYFLKEICKAGEPCADREGIPLIISTINTK